MKGHDDIQPAPARAYWTTQEIAERLGVEIDTVYALAAIGGLPHIRLGRTYRFPIVGVLEWERLQLIVNDGRCARPKVRRVSAKKARTKVFTAQPYAGPLTAKKKLAAA